MSDFVFIYSACGKSGSFIDRFDIPANIDGVACCDMCHSIINGRQAWYEIYGTPSVLV